MFFGGSEYTRERDTEAEQMCTCKNYFEALQMLYIIGQAVIISAIIKEKLHTPYPCLESLYLCEVLSSSTPRSKYIGEDPDLR